MAPVHVSGGVPIQKYLNDLLDRVPQAIHDDQFSVVSRENVAADSSDASSRSLDPSQVVHDAREAFLDELMSWMSRHVRVKVRIHGAERSVYVWQSYLEPSNGTGCGNDSSHESEGVELDSLERNIPLESISSESAGSADSAASENDVSPREMFQRYDKYSRDSFHNLTLVFSLLSWLESPSVSPVLVRLGEYSYHLGQLVPSKLYVKPTGIHVSERLEPGMIFR